MKKLMRIRLWALLAGVFFIFNVAMVHGQSALDGFDPNVNGTVRVVVVQPDGMILLDGDFTALSPNGGPAVVRNHIARLYPDGTLDAAFDPNATAVVLALRNLRDGAKVAGATEAQMAATALPFGGEKVPPSATVPVGSVDTSNRMQHTISWVEATTPDNRRRPAGAMGAEIYVKLDGAPPIDESQCTFVTVDSATPYTKNYDATDAGKMAHYLIRWRMRDGTTGPWSETISATITG